jgi:hypothetical protein
VVFLGAKVVDKQKGLIMLELLMCSLHRAIYFPDEHNVAWAEPLLKHEMTLQIAQGLAYLHTARPRITHGDMKPANVMLTDRNVCRIIDFGLSVVKESSRRVSHDPRIKAGNGTLHYQAPELLEAGASAKRDHKVDVYAYAVTILELFQQQQPYPSTMAEVDVKSMVQRGERPVVDSELVPADIVALINLAWYQNKDRRPEFTAIVMGLLHFLQSGTGIRTDMLAAAAAVAAVDEIPSNLLSDPQHEHDCKKELLSRVAVGHKTQQKLDQATRAAEALQCEREREAAEEAALAREQKRREKKRRLERAKQEKEAAEALQREREREAAEQAALAHKAAQREERQKLEQAKLERKQQQKEAAVAEQRERERLAADKTARMREAAEREKQKKLELEQKQKEAAEFLQREREQAAAEAMTRMREEQEKLAKLECAKLECAKLQREKEAADFSQSKMKKRRLSRQDCEN